MKRTTKKKTAKRADGAPFLTQVLAAIAESNNPQCLGGMLRLADGHLDALLALDRKVSTGEALDRVLVKLIPEYERDARRPALQQQTTGGSR